MRPLYKFTMPEDFDITDEVAPDNTLLNNENNKMDSQLKKRIKSLVWRAVMMGLATVITVVAESLTGLGLPTWITGVLGLILGEISKFLNTGIK